MIEELTIKVGTEADHFGKHKVVLDFREFTHRDKFDVESDFHREAYLKKMVPKIIKCLGRDYQPTISYENAHHDPDDALRTALKQKLVDALEDAIQEPGSAWLPSEDTFDPWAQSVINKERPKFISCGPWGSAISKIPLCLGHVTLFGAPPAGAKTACVNQLGFDALRMEGQEHFKLLNANVEMPASALLDRQLARFSNVSHSYINRRDYEESARPRIEAGIEELRAIKDRIEFMRPPFTLEHLEHRADKFEPDVVVLDYVQRFTTEARITDARAMTNLTMDCCRRLADQGRAVIVVSALSRHRGANGSTYDSKSLGLASFRESSELEYGADSAWLLLRDPESDSVELKCVKNRCGSLTSINLLFDGSRQSFRDDPQDFGGFPA